MKALRVSLLTGLLLFGSSAFANPAELDPGPEEDKLVPIPMSEIRKAVKMAEDYDILKLALDREKVRYIDLLVDYKKAHATIESVTEVARAQSVKITALTLQVRRRGIGMALGIAGTVLMFVVPATWSFLTHYFGG